MKNTGSENQATKKRGPYYKTRIRLTKKNVRNAIKGSGGIIQIIAERLNVEWHTVKRYLKNNPKEMQMVDAELNLYLDKAESHLLTAVNAGEKWAVTYFLDRKGRDRGYSFKTDITSKDEKIESGTVIILPDNNRDNGENKEK